MDRVPGELSPVVVAPVDEPFGPLVVGLVQQAGAPPAEAFAADLARESVDVRRLTGSGEPPSADLRAILVWLPRGAAREVYAGLVAWRARADRRVALVGCAPTGGSEDSERALAAGFDDFVAGRAAPREMSRRLRAVVRRSSASRAGTRRRFGRIRVEPDEHRLWVDGRRVTVTRTELAVMTALVEAGGQSRSRADLLERAWGDEALEVGERAVDNVIMRLRRKLPDPDLVVTVRGVGFRLAD
ncbi:MAG TPA: response regulator transcription factor [Kofleriaceae bacterium]